MGHVRPTSTGTAIEGIVTAEKLEEIGFVATSAFHDTVPRTADQGIVPATTTEFTTGIVVDDGVVTATPIDPVDILRVRCIRGTEVQGVIARGTEPLVPAVTAIDLLDAIEPCLLFGNKLGDLGPL